MTIYRKLILGSAASFLAMGAAQAADLPVKAKAVEYVRICSLYGAGFFYIPGTDTCIKLGGYLRVDTTFNGGAHGAPAWSGDLGQQNRFRDQFVSRSRMALTVDTRTATEYGVVRTFGQGDFQFNNFGSTQSRQVRLRSRLRASAARCFPPRAAATSRSNSSSSSSPASPSASPLRPTRRPGTVLRATSIRTCSAVIRPIPASTTSSTRRSSATASPAPSVSMIRRCGTGRPFITWASPARSAPTERDRVPMAARLLPTSSAESASIRPGACSSSRAGRTS